ncbi:MAG: hypothetical protein IT558_01745 [Alphaproteobacteria bacterium]|nr:hypothetical protein [Alphaproteobacteria bacterium]
MTSSDSPLSISGMEANNRPFEAPVREFLSALCKDPAQHARFLNMLSMLEHRGSRKIMISQMDRVLTEDILKHLAEEARHAYFFKRQAERVAKKQLDGFTDENAMCRIPALIYFGRLDAGISSRVAAEDAYPWVSLIIELRACWLYAMYHEVLQEQGVSISLKSLIAEEDMHLAEMFGMCGTDTQKLRALSAYETELFAKLFQTLQTELSTGVRQAPKAA